MTPTFSKGKFHVPHLGLSFALHILNCLRFIFLTVSQTFQLLYFQWLQLQQQTFLTSRLLLQIWFSRSKTGSNLLFPNLCFPGMVNAKCFPIAEVQPRTLWVSTAGISVLFFFLLHS